VNEAWCCSLQSGHGTGLLVEESPIIHPKSLFQTACKARKGLKHA
jgi:hypothetical protein